MPALSELGIVRRISQRVEKVVGKVKNVGRVSESDVACERRILAGEITPEDRETYKLYERVRLYALYIPDNSSVRFPAGLDFGLSFPLLPQMSADEFRQGIQEVNALPDEEVDQRLRARAEMILNSWRRLG